MPLILYKKFHPSRFEIGIRLEKITAGSSRAIPHNRALSSSAAANLIDEPRDPSRIRNVAIIAHVDVSVY